MADAKKCQHLPGWLADLLRHRPDQQHLRELHGLLERYQKIPGWTRFDNLFGVTTRALALPFCLAVGGLRFGPWGLVAGAIAGLTTTAETPQMWADWQARKTGIQRLEEWFETMGPPWLIPLPEGGWTDRRFPTSPCLPRRESRLDENRRTVAHEFDFHSATFECDPDSATVRVTHSSGQTCQFAAQLQDSDSPSLRLQSPPHHLLQFELDGRAYWIDEPTQTDDSWYWGSGPPGLLLNPGAELDNFPFPLEWLAPPPRQ